LFVGRTAVTLTLWATDPTYTQTNPVVDLSLFALGCVLSTVGFASQIRAPSIARLQQALPTLVVVPPDRRQLLTPGPGASRPLLAMAAVASGSVLLPRSVRAR
jgi:hypothetical protein